MSSAKIRKIKPMVSAHELVVVLIVIITLGSSAAFALEQKEIPGVPVYGRTISGNPTVCILEPETDIEGAWLRLSNYTKVAVLEWQNSLDNLTQKNHPSTKFNFTNSQNGSSPWDMKIQLAERQSKSGQYGTTTQDKPEFQPCSITVEFLPKPNKIKDWYQIAGHTERRSLDDIHIVIYYLKIEEFTTQKDGIKKSFLSYQNNSLASKEDLSLTIKHELGHALGLGHFIPSDLDDYFLYFDRSLEKNKVVVMPPSIMLPINPSDIADAEITELDLETLVYIYGKEGFSSEDELTSKEILRWFTLNSEWWKKGLISDMEFLEVIRDLVEMGLLGVTDTTIEDSINGTDTVEYHKEWKLKGTIPEWWFKKNLGWWSNEKITDEEFVNGIKYLMKK